MTSKSLPDSASDLLCHGCNTLFRPRGYVMHLSLTTNPACRRIHQQQTAASLSYDDSDNDDSDDTPGLTTDSNNVHAEECGPADVEMLDSPQNMHEDHVDLHGDQDMDEEDLEGRDGMVQEDEDPQTPMVEESDVDDADAALMQAELEGSWEPFRAGAPDETPSITGDPAPLPPAHAPRIKTRIPSGQGSTPALIVRYNDKYPTSLAGEVVSIDKNGDEVYAETVGANNSNPWAPFSSRLDWEIASWAKKRGASSTAFNELLSIDGIKEKLGLSYHTSDELNEIIDNKLPSRPQFRRHEVTIHGETVEFYSRDALECVKTLWGDPDFADDLIVQPERQYSDADKTDRIYHEMNTGKWWWSTQTAVETRTKKSRCTIVPIIISSDKTQLTLFRGQLAYPVYITIGNLPKHIRRKPSRQGQMLLAYLPTSKLAHITNKSSRRRCVSNMFHHCMQYVTKPLADAGRKGVILVSGDGKARRCYPILASYVGDYPEQALVALVKNGQCAVCATSRDEIGDPSKTQNPRSTASVIEALNTASKGSRAFTTACKEMGIKPVQSVFWKDLPDVHLYHSITPDILHQLYQGVLKHMISWIRELCGDEEIDARCRRFPPNHHIRLFMKGISPLSCVTGTEHRQISQFLLGLVADIQMPNHASNYRLVQCVRAVLDFMELARYPIHTDSTLAELQDALDDFHKFKQVFVDFGIREDFNIPKIHFMSHYVELIRRFGAPDNFNTEYTERLHIDLAKDAYAATNRKDEYSQMTRWLDRKERVIQHEKHIRRRLDTSTNSPPRVVKPPPALIPNRRIHMSKHPSTRAVSLTTLANDYGARDLRNAIVNYVLKYCNPNLSSRELEERALYYNLPFQKVPVFHRIKFVSHDMHSLRPLDNHVVDSIHIDPATRRSDGTAIPGRFDTALIQLKFGDDIATPLTPQDFRVVQVRCVFSFPKHATDQLFPGGFPHTHMAYVELFSAMSPSSMDRSTGLFKISRITDDNQRRGMLVPVDMIVGSVHLYPKFGPQAPVAWTSSNVLDKATQFYVNEFSDRFIYSLM
ncbi:hypothetical protein CVT24_006740 [Panaeolus cyanescens]|uniref:DUF6830 domain-containing protein n=1 Tax=Panaeolus cyanescens TaxID=181874 RepID=A0A409VD10_9AGAR|nr:hypothetical protein CVT24_006740 [Panaeolus cyanescens]